MKALVLSLLSLSALHGALSAPFNLLRSVQDFLAGYRGYPELASEIVHGLKKEAGITDESVFKLLGTNEAKLWEDKGTKYAEQFGVTYELFSSQLFSDYQLRLTSPQICDPTVKQHSGYLDITDGKHLFFWFFESRTNPAEAPLILWLNGGPGCSSTTGLLFELGPCNIQNDEGLNTSSNPFSWNTFANIIFLDQPVNTGYSYSDDGSTVNSSPEIGQDVYAFLQLFFSRFPKYSKLPFHIAAESYGGKFAPHLASIINKNNKKLAIAPQPNLLRINLASLVLANALTDPLTQYPSMPEFGCNGPYPIFDREGPLCFLFRKDALICQQLIKTCYDSDSRLACAPAFHYCETHMFGPIFVAGRNPYDVRLPCDLKKDSSLCYEETLWIDEWMNQDWLKKSVGANPELTFQSCNLETNRAFAYNGDGARNSAPVLPELLEDGIRLLAFAGNADFACNFMGIESWMLKLENKFHEEFNNVVPQDWISSGRRAGRVRRAGGSGAGNYTFVEVEGAGHMTPHDQPEAALDLIARWIENMPLTV